MGFSDRVRRSRKGGASGCRSSYSRMAGEAFAA